MRLDAEDAELKDEIKSRVEKRSGVDERASEAEATLAAAERHFAELTKALADLTAKRNQLESSVRTHRDRLARLDQQIASVQSEVEKLAQQTSGLGDLNALAGAVETAQQALASPKPRRKAPKPPMSPRGSSWKPPARRSPRPTSACSGWRPKRGPFPRSSMARPRTCGRRSSTASTSPKDMRRRSARRWATISMRRSIRRRRCAGPMPASARAIPRCPKASMRWPPTSKRPPNWRAVWRRSASSPRTAARNWCRS